MGRIHAAGINDVRSLAAADPETLKSAGMSDKETKEILKAVRGLCNERVLKESGVPPGSLKKYREAGITDPEDFCSLPVPYLALETGIKPETIYRHIEKVCAAVGREPPAKIPAQVLERGSKDLTALLGKGGEDLAVFYRAGIVDLIGLVAADPKKAAAAGGIPEERFRAYAAKARGLLKKRGREP